MLRGGGWNNNPAHVRVSYRNRNDPGVRNNNVGFRCLWYAGPSGVSRKVPELVGIKVPPGVLCPLPGSSPGDVGLCHSRLMPPKIKKVPVLW